MNKQSLSIISEKYNTDKKSSQHDFVKFYEKYFKDIRETTTSVLEIGLGGGQATGDSLKMWAEYFPNAVVFGIDIHDYTKFTDESKRIYVSQLDQGNEEHMHQFLNSAGPFDIIIEDGSHMQHHQQQNLAWLFPYVKCNGYLVIEDLYFSYYAPELDLKRLNETDTNTLDMLINFSKTGKIISDYMTEDQMKYIENNTEFFNIEYGSIQYEKQHGRGECGVFRKK